MTVEFKTSLIDSMGQRQEVKLSLDDYREAERRKMSLPQYINSKFKTDPSRYGQPFMQFLAAAGLFTRADRDLGIRPPTMKEVLDGTVPVSMGPISRPDGQDALTASGRLLFPALVLEMVESALRRDDSTYAAVFNRMVATTVNINSPRYEQPVVDLSGPQGSKSAPIAQGAMPHTMVTIKLADRSFRMPTYSIGLEITKEAQEASTLDLVSMVVREQALRERADRIDEDLAAIVAGDVDASSAYGPLSVVAATTYDAAATGGTMTHAAWVKFLRSKWRQRSIDWVITDLDTYLKIEGRTGRPTTQDDAAKDGRLNSLPTAANPGIEDRVNFFLVDDPSIIGGTNRLLGLDSRKAIRKVVYVGADYQATEEFVLRKTTAFRFDWSERHERLGFDDAFELLDFS
jgi:hypothetical protein